MAEWFEKFAHVDTDDESDLNFKYDFDEENRPPTPPEIKKEVENIDAFIASHPYYSSLMKSFENSKKPIFERLKALPPPTKEEIEARKGVDNCPYLVWGQIEPIVGNLGQRKDVLPLVFSTVLPSPFGLFRVISISAKSKNVQDFNARLRVLVYNQRYPLKCVCDIGFRFISLTYNTPPPQDDLEEGSVVVSTVKEYNFTVLLGPRNFTYLMDNEVHDVCFEYHPAPLIFPGDYVEVRGTIDYVSQFHCRTVYPKVWPPQQNRHNMEIFDGYFHYTIGTHVKPGHCFIITFRPFNEKGGVGVQLKAGPYRQTPFLLTGYFESTKPVEIQATTDDFEYVKPDYGAYFPFKFDEENRVAIMAGEDQFVIAINGTLYHKYRYRQSGLPGSLTDIKINCDQGLNVHCSKVDNSFIEDCESEAADKELARFSELDTEVPKDFYIKHYGMGW